MTTQNYFIMTEQQKNVAVGYNNYTAGVAVDPRLIDSATPGSGINSNELAVEYDVGDPITLVDMYTAPVRIVNDPQHLQHTPDMVEFLLGMPSCILENETIYLPSI